MRQEKPSDPQTQSAAIEREKRLYKMNYWGLVCWGRLGAIFDYSNMCQVAFCMCHSHAEIETLL